MPTAEITLEDIEKWVARESGYHMTAISLALKKGNITWIKHTDGKWTEKITVKK